MKKRVLAVITGMLLAQQSIAYSESLDNMQLKFLDGKNVLNFDFSSKFVKPDILKSDSELIHLRFPQVNNKLNSEYFNIDEGDIKNIKLEERAGNLHVYISLLEKQNLLFNYTNDITSLELQNNIISYENIDKIEDNIDYTSFIDDVKFERDNNSQSKISVSFNSDDLVYDSLAFENGVEFTFKNSSIPSRLFRNNDVHQFGTPILNYLTRVKDGNVILRIEFDDRYKSDYFLTKEKNKLIILVNGKKKAEQVITSETSLSENKTVSSFNGELISFNFQDMPVKDALYTIAAKMNLNLVLADNVDGKVTLLLKDVPYDQALNIILRTKGLGKHIEGNIMLIAPIEEIVKREEFELSSKNKIKEIKPLVSDTVQINYAKSSDIQKLLETVKSNRGKIIFDERTNKMFIEDTAEKLFDMKDLIKKVDIPVRQVSVEARIVYAKKSAAKKMGVKWGSGINTSSYDQLGNSSVGIGDGSFLGANGSAGDAASLALGFLNANVDVTLTALEEKGDVEIVARPLILAANKQKSKISSGKEYPYLKLSDDGEATTEFKEIVLSLEVTPQITPDDKLILDLSIVQDSIAELTDSGPALDSTNIETQVIVNNNETLVLGGVFKDDIVTEKDQVPVLGDIPFIGRAFQYSEDTTEKVELLIFITPKILNGDKIINK